jgi:hypothetical protein
MKRTPVVAGVADHNGWAILVCIAAKDGTPAVIDRRRVELIDGGLPNQPYEHETLNLSAAAAEELVKEVRESAAHCAERALSRLRSGLGASQELVSIALRTAPLPRLPGTVAEVHASYSVTNRADAMLYHDALCGAARSLGIGVTMLDRGQEVPRAAEALGTTTADVEQFLAGLRGTLGPPWQQDHRAAAARAIAALGKHVALGPPKVGRVPAAGRRRQ